MLTSNTQIQGNDNLKVVAMDSIWWTDSFLDVGAQREAGAAGGAQEYTQLQEETRQPRSADGKYYSM